MKRIYYSLRDLPKEHLFISRSRSLKSRIVSLLYEKQRLEEELEQSQLLAHKNSDIKPEVSGVEKKLANLEIREDRLYRELERLTVLTERADSLVWRWLMFIFALTNLIITLVNFWLHTKWR